MFGHQSRWQDSLMGVAIAAAGALLARPWWKAAIVVVFGGGFALWGYWRAPSEQERRRAR